MLGLTKKQAAQQTTEQNRETLILAQAHLSRPDLEKRYAHTTLRHHEAKEYTRELQQYSDERDKTLKDVKKKRTEDRKSWFAEKARRITAEKKIAELHAEIMNLERRSSSVSSASTRSTQTSDPPGNEDPGVSNNRTIVNDSAEIDLLRLENKRLKSQQTLTEDLTKEIQALHADKDAKARDIANLLADHNRHVEEIAELNTDRKEWDRERAWLHRDYSDLRAKIGEIKQENYDLAEQLQEQKKELETYQQENEQQKGQRRKLAAFFKDIGLTKDDFEEQQGAAKARASDVVPSTATPSNEISVTKESEPLHKPSFRTLSVEHVKTATKAPGVWLSDLRKFENTKVENTRGAAKQACRKVVDNESSTKSAEVIEDDDEEFRPMRKT